MKCADPRTVATTSPLHGGWNRVPLLVARIPLRFVVILTVLAAPAGCNRPGDVPDAAATAADAANSESKENTPGAEPDVPAERIDPANSSPGTIRGRVLYTVDAARPWRLGRYYLRDTAGGHLAEAVVALEAKSLRGWPPPKQPTTHVVDQKDHLFVPETTVLRAGSRVRFTNSDPQVHNVSTTHWKDAFNVNTAPGGFAEHHFDKPTRASDPVVIGCVLHSSMRAWIFVMEHPFYDLTGESGEYHIDNVPAGEYRLVMNHPAGALSVTRNVTIPPGETLQIDIPTSPDDRAP